MDLIEISKNFDISENFRNLRKVSIFFQIFQKKLVKILENLRFLPF